MESWEREFLLLLRYTVSLIVGITFPWNRKSNRFPFPSLLLFSFLFYLSMFSISRFLLIHVSYIARPLSTHQNSSKLLK